MKLGQRFSTVRNATISDSGRDWLAEQKKRQEELRDEEMNTGCGGPRATEAATCFDEEFENAVAKALYGTISQAPTCSNDEFFGFSQEEGAAENTAPDALPPGLVVSGAEQTLGRPRQDIKGRGAQHVASQPPMCGALTTMPTADGWWLDEDYGTLGAETAVSEEEDSLAKYLAGQLKGCGGCALRNYQHLPATLRIRIQYYIDEMEAGCCHPMKVAPGAPAETVAPAQEAAAAAMPMAA